ncbi:MAG: anhydro-N-acetylmuramic acid kinase [Ferruginibacter sp.]|nr:anhydro-N-acetylmuramic acid kinase [Ferruginibacter sp.]
MMNQLHHIAQKPARRIIGVMSGTSIDGLDIAQCLFHHTGTSTQVEVEAFTTIPYENDFKEALHRIAQKQTDLEQLTLWHKRFGVYTAEQVLQQLRNWNTDKSTVDLIASHGQTIFHAPLQTHHREEFGDATLQIGDADQIAYRTGIITLSDFRQKHIAAGGAGAPLAAYTDWLLFSSEVQDVVMLNIGGIANYTYLPCQPYKKMFSTDTGPGNTLMDSWMRTREGLPYDKDAALASKGEVIQPMLDHLLKHPFLQLQVPKTTGPETFNLDIFETTQLNIFNSADVMATLNFFTAYSIAENIKQFASYLPVKIYCSGGGAHNPLLMQHLRNLLPQCHFHLTEEKNIPGDAKEALLIALLANECIAGNPEIFNSTGLPAVRLGKISLPS